MSNPNLFLGCLAEADNLRAEDASIISDLVNVFRDNRERNRKLASYYDAKVSLLDINIGIAIPDSVVAGLGCACSWPAIAVASLQRRSHFDSIQSPDGTVKGDYDRIIQESRLIANYRKACIEQLKTGCVFATLSMVEETGRAAIRWHTAESASALWDGVNDRISAGMAIISTKKFNRDRSFKPSRVHVYTSTDTIVLISGDGVNWSAEYIPHKMGRPLFGALIYKPSFSQPFGESRITRAVRAHTDTALRAMCRLELAAEVYSSPQKVLLNASESLAEQVKQQQHSMAMYLSNMLALTADEDGETPDIKVLAASSMEPHISVLREAACLFASDTGVPLNSLGIVQDNPSSAEAIYAAKEDLVIQTTDLNAENGWSLVDLCKMAYAMNEDLEYSSIDEAHRSIEAHFLNPSTPSVASSADAFIKIASVLPSYASSDVGLESLGLDNEQIMRLRSHLDTQTADTILSELTAAVRAASNDES